MSGLERDIVGRAQDFLIQTARRDVGPRLRSVYEERVGALRRGQEGNLVVRPKNPFTIEPTTSADTDIDNRLRIAWEGEFPDIPWYSEDSKNKIVEGLKIDELKRLPWLMVIDSIDGSGELARGSARFSSSFGLVSYGKVVLAVVYEPVGDAIWTADATTDGAFRNEQRIKASNISDLDKARVSTAFAWDIRQRIENHKALGRLIYYVSQFKGSASSVLDGADVAQGAIDAHVSVGLKPWDMAGFSCLVERADGQVTTLAGDNWSPFEPNIVASNGLIHKDLITVINKNAMMFALMTLYRIYFRRDIRNRGPIDKALNQVRRGMVFLRKASGK